MEIIDEKTGLPQPSSTELSGAVLVHLASFGSLILPFGNILGPLIFWLIKKDQSTFVDFHGKESLNFQITYTIFQLVLIGLGVGSALTFGFQDNEGGIAISVIGFIVLMAIYWTLALVFVIVAAVKANQKEYYRYPLSIRFIK
jgi:uncharacterized Tic20 family protein